MKKVFRVFLWLLIICTITFPYTMSRYVSSLHKIINLNVREPKYNITFNKNDDLATGTMAAEEFSYGETKTLTPNAFTKDGYLFDGWTTNADGTGTTYSDDDSISNVTTVEGYSLPLYAKWILYSSYNISYIGSITLNQTLVNSLSKSADMNQPISINFGSNEVVIAKVMMGGAEINPSFYTFNNNTLSIASVTGDLIISVGEMNNEVEYVISMDTGIPDETFTGATAISTTAGIVANAHIHALNGGNVAITGITVSQLYQNTKGNKKTMRAILSVDNVQIATTDFIYAQKTKTDTTVTFSFTKDSNGNNISINPASLLYITYEVVDSNNDSITVKSQSVSLAFASN